MKTGFQGCQSDIVRSSIFQGVGKDVIHWDLLKKEPHCMSERAPDFRGEIMLLELVSPWLYMALTWLQWDGRLQR